MRSSGTPGSTLRQQEAARLEAFKRFYKKRLRPKPTPGGIRRNAPFVPYDPNDPRLPGKKHRGQRA